MFTLKDCGGFKYWYAHWKAFNKVARQCHAWKFKYLFHDIEKPLMMLFGKDFESVQKWHVDHKAHHPQNKPFSKVDVEGMLIDWECGRYTKSFATMTAREFYDSKYRNGTRFSLEEQKVIEATLDKLGL